MKIELNLTQYQFDLLKEFIFNKYTELHEEQSSALTFKKYLDCESDISLIEYYDCKIKEYDEYIKNTKIILDQLKTGVDIIT